jgi:site-specific DNA-methyltransferase (adenine-specific)
MDSTLKSAKTPRGIFKAKSDCRIIPFCTRGYLCESDALEFLASLSDKVADIVFLDPPFNLGKDYGSRKAKDDNDPEAYQRFMTDIVNESIRVLKVGGALFLYHLPYWATRLAPILHGRMEFRHWIAVSMKNGFARGERLYPAHYALLYFTKGQPKTFKRPRLAPQMCRHCRGMIKDYGGYTSIITQKGINLSDVWDDVSPVRHSKYKTRDANELPRVITDRIVKIAGRKLGLLVDPFVGSGVSLISALRAGMKFAGNDVVKRNITVCLDRLCAEGKTTKASSRISRD